jgi:hypothetical protein
MVIGKKTKKKYDQNRYGRNILNYNQLFRDNQLQG